VAILPVKLGGERRRILIADDNRDAADSLAFVLRRVGHEVRTAYDGEEALDMASSFRPELALLDIGMPRLNGYDTAQRIRKETYGREDADRRPYRLGPARRRAEIRARRLRPSPGQAGRSRGARPASRKKWARHRGIEDGPGGGTLAARRSALQAAFRQGTAARRGIPRR
jgi:hypothetical protein